MRFDTWAEFLDYQRRQPYTRGISEAVQHDRLLGAVYPRSEDVFRFTETPLRDVRVVILGQDPYHGRGQADGLAFSVRDPSVCPRCLNHSNMRHYCEKAGRDVDVYAQPLPPSLRNILREMFEDLVSPTYTPPSFMSDASKAAEHERWWHSWLQNRSGNLTPWTRQGVLLLNTALTVRHGEAGSHLDIWRPFTDEVIRAVCDSATVAPHFILWGEKAKRALERVVGRKLTPTLRHPDAGLIIVGSRERNIRQCTATYSAHPSPLSADKGFFGSRPFSRANLALTLNNPGCVPVDWRLS
jgi:uracil-DNA glycosylase